MKLRTAIQWSHFQKTENPLPAYQLDDSHLLYKVWKVVVVRGKLQRYMLGDQWTKDHQPRQEKLNSLI